MVIFDHSGAKKLMICQLFSEDGKYLDTWNQSFCFITKTQTSFVQQSLVCCGCWLNFSCVSVIHFSEFWKFCKY